MDMNGYELDDDDAILFSTLKKIYMCVWFYQYLKITTFVRILFLQSFLVSDKGVYDMNGIRLWKKKIQKSKRDEKRKKVTFRFLFEIV